MGDVSTIGLDIAKSVFQVHGVDVAGAVLVRKRVSRAKVCWNTSVSCRAAWSGLKRVRPHHRGRELQALSPTVRLIPPSYVTSNAARTMQMMRPRSARQ
jgi:transposase